MKILLATDGSSHAEEAAQLVSNMRGPEPLLVTVLTASYSPDDIHSATSEPWFPEWRERESHRIEKHYNELRDLLGKTAESVDFVQTDGNAAQCILDHAESIKADLIVMGARGHSLIGRILLGSVSDTVATHAHCSVLVIRPSDRHDDDQTKAMRIMLAYDGSDGSKAAAQELQRIEWNTDASVDVVSVIPTFDFYGPEYAPAMEAKQQDIEPHMLLAAEQVASKFSSAFASRARLVRGDHIGDSIVLAAEQIGSDLIVVGENRHGLIGEILMGSTTKYVLRHAKQSVWISRHHRTTTSSPADDQTRKVVES